MSARLELITRRTAIVDMLKGAAVVGFKVAAPGGVGVAVVKTLLFTPDRPEIKEDENYDFNPGWIEARTKAKFIDPDNDGHLPFLREAVINNPVLKDLTKEYFGYFNENLEKKQRIGLGDALYKAVEMTHEKLKNTDPSKINPKTNLILESMHAGLFVFAAGFMPWFSTDNLKEIGVNMGAYNTSFDYFSALWKDVYPKLFAKKEIEKDPTNLETGQDRAVHFAQHLLLTYEFLYSRRFNLNIETSVPFLLKGYDFVMSEGNYLTEDYRLRKEAPIFSQGLGLGWEYSNLFDGKNWPFFGPTIDEIREGPWDLSVDADYKGNGAGASAGADLFHRSVTGESLDIIISVMKRFNDKRYYYFEAKPAA